MYEFYIIFNFFLNKGPIFPYGDEMERIGSELANCALMMCEATGEFSDNNIPAVIIDNLTELRKCIMEMLQLMIDGRDIMSSSFSLKKKIKKLKAWLKKVKKQKAAIKKKVNALWDELTKKEKKKLKMARKKLNKEMKRLCKKIEALIKKLSALLTTSG